MWLQELSPSCKTCAGGDQRKCSVIIFNTKYMSGTCRTWSDGIPRLNLEFIPMGMSCFILSSSPAISLGVRLFSSSRALGPCDFLLGFVVLVEVKAVLEARAVQDTWGVDEINPQT